MCGCAHVCVREGTSQFLVLIQPSLYCDRLFNKSQDACVAPEDDVYDCICICLPR